MAQACSKIHQARTVEEWSRAHEIIFTRIGPDIKNLWDVLERVRPTHPSSKQDLGEKLIQRGTEINLTLQNLTGTMLQRRRAIICKMACIIFCCSSICGLLLRIFRNFSIYLPLLTLSHFFGLICYL